MVILEVIDDGFILCSLLYYYLFISELMIFNKTVVHKTIVLSKISFIQSLVLKTVL